VDFGELPIFQNAATFPAIIITKNTHTMEQNFLYAPIKRLDFLALDNEVELTGHHLSSQAIDNDNWSLTSDTNVSILRKIESAGIPLEKYISCKIYNGIKTGLNKAFIIDAEIREKLISENPSSAEVIKPFLMGRDINRYQSPVIDKYLLFIPWHFPLHNDPSVSGASLNAEAFFKRDYPAIYNHLLTFKSKLTARASDETGIRYEWYALQRFRPEYYHEFEKQKIVYIDIAREPKFIFDDKGTYTDMTLFFIPTTDFYLLGVLNSSTSWFYLKHKCSVLGDPAKHGRLRLKTIYMKDLPIPSVNSDYRDRMVSLVEQMLFLHKHLQEARTPHEKTGLQRQIEATDCQIDALVYELYGLTEEEIRIVEGT
jgi:hypothetical protein